MAPEIWKYEEHSQQIDVWAAGCVLYAMIYG